MRSQNVVVSEDEPEFLGAGVVSLRAQLCGTIRPLAEEMLPCGIADRYDCRVLHSSLHGDCVKVMTNLLRLANLLKALLL